MYLTWHGGCVGPYIGVSYMVGGAMDVSYGGGAMSLLHGGWGNELVTWWVGQ